jgi:hypothetical protein
MHQQAGKKLVSDPGFEGGARLEAAPQVGKKKAKR